jgi:hypothetical protein
LDDVLAEETDDMLVVNELEEGELVESEDEAVEEDTTLEVLELGDERVEEDDD